MKKIRIRTDCNERGRIYYYRDFAVVTEIPKVGEEYEGGVVLAVEKVRKDPEQPSFECDDYDCFAVSLELPPEDTVEDGQAPVMTKYIAISAVEPHHLATLDRFPVLVPTIDEANILMGFHAGRAPELLEIINSYGADKENDRLLGDRADLARELLKEMDSRCEEPDEPALKDWPYQDSELIQKLFGISPEKFEKAVLDASGVHIGSMLPVKGEDPDLPGGRIVATPYGFELQAMVPYCWEDTDALEISEEDIKELFKAGFIPRRTVKDLHPDVFSAIVNDFLEFGEDWMAEEGFPAWFHLISVDPEEMVRICEQLTWVLSCPFRDFLKKAGISQRGFSRRFFVNIRTVEDWCSGKNQCKVYLRLLFADKLGLFDKMCS